MKSLFITVLSIFMLTSCSTDQDKEEGKSSIDQATKKVADTAVEYIKTPIEKAEAVKEIEEERGRKLKEQVQ